MKLSLMVAQGVHEGKMIPIPVAQFVIGRDEGCQLRPSSPAVSKKHCGLFVKGEQVFAKDMGSTNGTFVNGQQIAAETELQDGDRLKVGPLEFVVKLDKAAVPTPAKPQLKVSKTPSREEPKPKVAEKPADDAEQSMAALLLATDDGPPGPLTEASIPEGTTVFEMQAVDPNDPNAKPAPKPPEPLASTSDAADAILRKYMRRPRT